MSKVFRIVGICGSLRKDSWNAKLLKAFAAAALDEEFARKGIQFEIVDWSKCVRGNVKPLLIIDSLCTMETWNPMCLLQSQSLRNMLLVLMELSL
jgi:hypothetical protein